MLLLRTRGIKDTVFDHTRKFFWLMPKEMFMPYVRLEMAVVRMDPKTARDRQ